MKEYHVREGVLIFEGEFKKCAAECMLKVMMIIRASTHCCMCLSLQLTINQLYVSEKVFIVTLQK